MKTLNLYTLAELKEQFPDGYAAAVERWQERDAYDFGIPWQDEIVDSLKAVVKAAGLILEDWNLGAYDRNNYVTIRFQNSDAEDITGKRAFAWLENNLFGPLRISFTARNRWELAKYNGSYSPRAQFYTAGHVPPCPLTGYYSDDDYLETLRERVKRGDTLKEAFECLADTCRSLLEAEAEDVATEHYFAEHAGANGWNFTEEGGIQ